MQTIVERGRANFVWHARLKPIGLPVAAGAALWSLRRERSALRAFVAAGTSLALTLLEAQLEFEFRRAAYRRAELAERRRQREVWRGQVGY